MAFRLFGTILVTGFVLIKVFFYIRVYQDFGILVELISGTFSKIKYFLGFVLLINAFWALLYNIIGFTYEETANLDFATNQFL